MSGPLVTIGVPVFHGQDSLPVLLERLRTQSYRNLDILISVDNRDEASARAAQPCLDADPRFRMAIQPHRLGWAGNTDWTMRNARGDFYIYQQHDDLVSADYVAELVAAAQRWPNAAICFARVRLTGDQNEDAHASSLLGDPMTRVLTYLRRLDWVPLRGLIRTGALKETDGLLLSDFDPNDSFGTEFRFMAQLARLGEFRLVEGPMYFKSWHGKNLSGKRAGWSREHEIAAYACLAAWMIEVVVPVGETTEERRELFAMTLDRFAAGHDLIGWIATARDWLQRRAGKAAAPVAEPDRRKRASFKRTSAIELPSGQFAGEERSEVVRQVMGRLRRDARLDPGATMDLTWDACERALARE